MMRDMRTAGSAAARRRTALSALTVSGVLALALLVGCESTDGAPVFELPGTGEVSDSPDASAPDRAEPAPEDDGTGAGEAPYPPASQGETRDLAQDPDDRGADPSDVHDAAAGESSAGELTVGVDTASASPLEGDMLTAEESARATSLALEAASGMLAAATDRDAVGATADLSALAEMPTYRVMYSQRFATKDEVARSAEVAFYRYDTNEVVLARVALDTDEVLPMAVPPGYMAPLLPQEIDEAARAARQSEEVRALLRAAGIEPEEAVANGLLTTLSEADRDHPCGESRCVRLFFSGAGDAVVPTFMAIVDVSSLEVVEIAPLTPAGESDAELDAAAGEDADEAQSAPPASETDTDEETTP